jgi:fission 1 protein
VLKRQYIKEGEYVTIQTKFNYAWGLVRSASNGQVEQGIQLLVGKCTATLMTLTDGPL